MRVGILTFHASHNYGSMLQAYALQNVLTKFGVDTKIINFRSDIQKLLVTPPVEFKHPRSSLRKLLREPVKTLALRRKYYRFEDFLNQELNITEELQAESDVVYHIQQSDYDAIVTGSDQIWNPACLDFSAVYLCDFPLRGKRIAYAPSMGSHPEKIDEAKQKSILELVSEYNFISTREVRGSAFLEAGLRRKVDVVLDPTLLLVAEDYRAISSEDILNRKYILYYTPREEEGTFKSALSLSEKLGLDIVVTQDYNEYRGYKNVIFKLDCGPREFLSLIKNASYCIGNSFHLLAFSLIFHREFLLLSYEKDSRMVNILSSLGLSDRLITPGHNFVIPDRINFTTIDGTISILKTTSISYLCSALDLC